MPFNSGQITSGLAKSLTLVANDFVIIMKKYISQNNLPSVISSSIEVDKVQASGGNLSIEVRAGKNAPMTKAFEYGSGEHATRGSKGRYKIEGNPLLAIPRSRWKSYQPPPDVDPVILPYVLHPGVAPRPFVEPALRESLPKMKAELGKAIKAEILVGIQRVTVISA